MWPNGVPKHSHCFPSETTESLITSQDPAILSKQSSSHQKDLYEAEIKYFFFSLSNKQDKAVHFFPGLSLAGAALL